MQPSNLGVGIDTRTPAQKEFDYKHEELFDTAKTATTITYLTSRVDASFFVGKFPVDNQFQTSSCVAHGKCLVMSIFAFLQNPALPFRQLSSMFIYRNRANYPGEGMVPASANMQVVKNGAPIYADLPTPQTEEQANALVIDAATIAAAKEFATGKWVSFTDPTDVDQMAFVSNSLMLPMNILLYATEVEWSQDTVEVLTPGLTQADPRAIVRHCVTILPKSAYMENGKRHVIIQDSAGFGGIFYRAVAEDFLTARVYEADYMIAMGTNPVTVKPKGKLNGPLTMGATGPDVIFLQQVLQYMGYLPNVLDSKPFAPTGVYAGLTKNGVLQLQNAHAAEILTLSGLTVGTGYCGQSTEAWINAQFA